MSQDAKDLHSSRVDRLNFLADVAEALLVEGLTQQDASKRFGLSRPSISRLLGEARDEGLVKIEIRRVMNDRADLAQAIVDRFGIKSANVSSAGAPGKGPSATDLAFVRFSAERVYSSLPAGTMLGITLGKTIGRLIHEIAKSEPRQISVVQLCGSVGAGEPLLDSHALAAHLAREFGISCLHFHAPYAVESRELRDAINGNPSNQLCLEQARKVDAALVGIGDLNAPDSALLSGGHINADTLEDFKQAGAIGDAGGYYFAGDGRPVDLDDSHFWRTGISAEHFFGIPRRIGVATGAFKVNAIRAAMLGGWINELVTDQYTAEGILAAP